ncbi:MAG: bifunctional sterol desaturase/short chain dehydrogenase [Pseudanabaenaceae cyanobacterium]
MLWLTHIVYGVLGLLLAELARDVYHIGGHYYPPLMKWHNLHHKAYRPDLTKTSEELYRKAEFWNDSLEAMFMVGITAIAGLIGDWGLWLGTAYAFSFLVTSLGRSRGLWHETDLTHRPGPLTAKPSRWLVNRTYHWRHHFDRTTAYFGGTFTFIDQLLGTALALKHKTIAITGASGALGQALICELQKHGAQVIALTTSHAEFPETVEVCHWELHRESEWQSLLERVDILILNHGVNVHQARDPEAIHWSYEVNTWSVWRWFELFLSTVKESEHYARKEVWINTSEAEVSPAFSPLYELSKRTIGDLITLRRLDAPCIVRKLILGPFKSKLNPIGVMSPQFVAWAIVQLAKRDVRNIIVSIIPFTYITFPISEFMRSLYYRLFSRRQKNAEK